MKSRPLFWQLYPLFLITSLVSTGAVLLFVHNGIEQFFFENQKESLKTQLQLIQPQVQNLIIKNKYSELDSLCKDLGKTANVRLTVVASDGSVLGDTQIDPQLADNHGQRPEIRRAQSNGFGSSIRYSQSVENNRLYVALRIEAQDQHLGVARVSVPLTHLESILWKIHREIFIAALILLLLVSLVSWIVARRLSRPLEAMTLQAKAIAEGDFGHKVDLQSSQCSELLELSEAINETSVQLARRINTVLEQKSEQEAILSSMKEGVLAIDKEYRVVQINHAAAALLDADLELVKSQLKFIHIEEVLRYPALIEFVEKALKSNSPLEDEIQIPSANEKILQVRAAPLVWAQGSQNGIVLVFNDVTQLKKLENHRREFVANVSHELRTPLTTIQGFAETLRNPSVQDPKERTEFLGIIESHAARLGAIIEDLLALSKVERESEEGGIELQLEPLKPTIKRAIEVCSPRAKEKHHNIRLECTSNVEAKINGQLLEQAIVNLLDNAIKYSNGSTGDIEVMVSSSGPHAIIKVRDHGQGIPDEHIPRLFERFYRVDKARSRDIGGTGLGLSIVKHIALAHHGSVSVSSQIGSGSEFAISLPLSH